MKKNNMFQTPRFFCDIYCFEPGQEQKGHIHGEQDKVYLVLEGQGTFQVGSEKQVLGPGQGTHGAGRRRTWREESHGPASQSPRVRRAECERKDMRSFLCSRSARPQNDAKEQADRLLARRAPTIKRWSLDARSEEQSAYSFWES